MATNKKIEAQKIEALEERIEELEEELKAETMRADEAVNELENDTTADDLIEVLDCLKMMVSVGHVCDSQRLGECNSCQAQEVAQKMLKKYLHQD